MMAVRTALRRDAIEGVEPGLAGLRHSIEQAIPTVGRMPVYNQRILPGAEPKIAELERLAAALGIRPDVYDARWQYQLGSLGGGNHFIEVVTDETRTVWLFLHSGSRGVGNRMASAAIGNAVAYCQAAGIALEDRDLAFLVEGEDGFEEYVACVEWAQRFAWLNRVEMMDRLIEQVARHVSVGGGFEDLLPSMRLETIACHHNYTTRQPDGSWLTRKGAIDATKGTLGLIPGSMGAASYVVRGRGNAQALFSAPHGAGRRLSRSKAKATFTLDDLRDQTAGVEIRLEASLVDELPAAYKDINRVMELAAPLVEPLHAFRQFVNVKGD
jgi:tRNA-splicing ligase RtcB